MKKPRSWVQDTQFVQWLIEKEYAYRRGEIVKPYLRDAVVLYMWEAWRAAKVRPR